MSIILSILCYTEKINNFHCKIAIKIFSSSLNKTLLAHQSDKPKISNQPITVALS